MTCSDQNLDIPWEGSGFACGRSNFVVDIQAGVAANVTGIALEANLNVRHVHCGDASATSMATPYATPFYIATGGDKRATAAIMVNCSNAAAGNMPFNRGIVFWGGSIRLNTIEDHCALPNGSVLFATGQKAYGIHLGNCTFTGAAITTPNFALYGDGTMSFRMLHGGIAKSVIVDGNGFLKVQ